jgi:hypothetical protein
MKICKISFMAMSLCLLSVHVQAQDLTKMDAAIISAGSNFVQAWSETTLKQKSHEINILIRKKNNIFVDAIHYSIVKPTNTLVQYADTSLGICNIDFELTLTTKKGSSYTFKTCDLRLDESGIYIHDCYEERTQNSKDAKDVHALSDFIKPDAAVSNGVIYLAIIPDHFNENFLSKYKNLEIDSSTPIFLNLVNLAENHDHLRQAKNDTIVARYRREEVKKSKPGTYKE